MTDERKCSAGRWRPMGGSVEGQDLRTHFYLIVNFTPLFFFSFTVVMFTRVLLLCFFLGVGAVHWAAAEECALARQRFNSTFEAILAEAPAHRETVLRLEPFATLFPHCVDAPSCTDLWKNVRDGVPAECDATCWADVERTFLRKHGECAGVNRGTVAGVRVRDDGRRRGARSR